MYDGKDILLITTEVSDKAMKDQIGNFTGYPVNYDPKLTKSQDIGNLWIFKNGVKGPGFMGFQASVVDSIPGDPGYTPKKNEINPVDALKAILDTSGYFWVPQLLLPLMLALR